MGFQEKLRADNENFVLSDVEVETLRRAAELRSLPFDPGKTIYTRRELLSFGLVREGYNRDELRMRGIYPVEVTSFDEKAKAAEKLLNVDAPFGPGIKKWQLPIDMEPLRIHQTVFPPNSKIHSHVHPEDTPEAPGGGLRIIVKGAIHYKGKVFGPGDWFFIPNGVPYEFSSHPTEETITFYKYAFFAAEHGNRFSHPHGNVQEAGSESKKGDEKEPNWV